LRTLSRGGVRLVVFLVVPFFREGNPFKIRVLNVLRHYADHPFHVARMAHNGKQAKLSSK
jgi:hypothetical protein